MVLGSPSPLRSGLFLGLTGILLGLTLLDFSSSGGVASASSDSLGKDVPAPKFASMMAGPSIKFLYW